MGPSQASFWEPFGLQYASKTAPRAPRTRPTEPKRPPRPPQERPRSLPGRPKRPPRPLQEDLRWPSGSRRPLGSYLGPILLYFRFMWMPKQAAHKPADDCSRGSYKTPSNTRTLPRTGQKTMTRSTERRQQLPTESQSQATKRGGGGRSPQGVLQ